MITSEYKIELNELKFEKVYSTMKTSGYGIYLERDSMNPLLPTTVLV